MGDAGGDNGVIVWEMVRDDHVLGVCPKRFNLVPFDFQGLVIHEQSFEGAAEGLAWDYKDVL